MNSKVIGDIYPNIIVTMVKDTYCHIKGPINKKNMLICINHS